jgi:hypothetical protein
MTSFYLNMICEVICGIKKIFWYNKVFPIAVASGVYNNRSAEAINNTRHNYQVG